MEEAKARAEEERKNGPRPPLQIYTHSKDLSKKPEKVYEESDTMFSYGLNLKI